MTSSCWALSRIAASVSSSRRCAASYASMAFARSASICGQLGLDAVGLGLPVGETVSVRAPTEEREQDEQRQPPEESSAAS